MIRKACEADRTMIMNLYRSMLHGAAEWNEQYPNEDTITFDLQRDSLFVREQEDGNLSAVISIDEDEMVEQLDCWDPQLRPVGEVSRLCVHRDYQQQGIAKEMMQYALTELRNRGMKGAHLLVKKAHVVAIRCYEALGFRSVSECDLYTGGFLCMEKKIEDE